MRCDVSKRKQIKSVSVHVAHPTLKPGPRRPRPLQKSSSPSPSWTLLNQSFTEIKLSRRETKSQIHRVNACSENSIATFFVWRLLRLCDARSGRGAKTASRYSCLETVEHFTLVSLTRAGMPSGAGSERSVAQTGNCDIEAQSRRMMQRSSASLRNLRDTQQ